jgi:lysine decarboxylase
MTADWLREQRYVDVGMSDHRRILATLSFADDRYTAARLIGALSDWSSAAPGFDKPPAIDLPSPSELQLETAILPRDAFFGRTEMIDASRAAARVAAEELTPYPPGIPAVIPGELLNDAVIDYLRSGASAGMSLPDAADPQVDKIRVVA